MNSLMKRLVPVAVVCAALALASCSSVGPLTLNLAPSQAFSGANRTMESVDAIAKKPDSSGIEYKVFGDLGTTRISGFAFSIGSKPDSKDWLRNIASALNISGDVVKDSKNTFTIGLNKDTGAGVWLWADDAGSWWSYFPGSVAAVTEPCASGTDCAHSQPTKPQHLLSEDEAVAQATRFLIQVGFRLNGFRLEAKKNEYSVEVTGNLVVSNIPTNLNFTFSYGENGALMSASGPLVTIRIANGYYIVTPEEGVNRLSDSRYASMGTGTRVAIDMASQSKDASSNAGLTVPITRVEYTLMQSVLANNTTILLPAYTYYNEEGVVGTVIAMKDEYLKFGEMPVNTDEPATLNTGGTSSSGSGSSGSAPSQPTTVAATPEAANLLVGLSEDEATKVAMGNGWAVRVAMRDGEAFQLTTNYVDSRVNFTIVKGKVTAVSIG